jgi:hypothetical protein
MSDETNKESVPTEPTKSANAPKVEVKSNKPILLGAASLLVAVLLGTAIFFLVGKGSGGEEGKDIPNDFETYENDDFKIGYPEDWEVEESSYLNSGVTLRPKLEESEDDEDFLAGLGDLMSGVFINDMSDKTSDIKKIEEGKCEELVNDILESQSIEEGENVEVDVKSQEAVELNGSKACKFEINAKAKEGAFSFEILIFMYAVAGDDKGYSVGVTSFGEKSDSFDEAIEVSKTFTLK